MMHDFIWKTLLFSVSGLILGDLINSTFTRLCKKFPKFRFAILFLQFSALGIVLNVMYRFFSHNFAEEFQTTLPGLSFPAFYFAAQKNILTIWYDTSFSKFLNSY